MRGSEDLTPNLAPWTVLVGITWKPLRAGFPIGYADPVGSNWHLDLRQIVLVENFVMRDDLVEREQVGRQRIDFIGCERSLVPERHAAMDVIPHDGRIRRQDW